MSPKLENKRNKYVGFKSKKFSQMFALSERMLLATDSLFGLSRRRIKMFCFERPIGRQQETAKCAREPARNRQDVQSTGIKGLKTAMKRWVLCCCCSLFVCFHCFLLFWGSVRLNIACWDIDCYQFDCCHFVTYKLDCCHMPRTRRIVAMPLTSFIDALVKYQLDCCHVPA